MKKPMELLQGRIKSKSFDEEIYITHLKNREIAKPNGMSLLKNGKLTGKIEVSTFVI